MVVEDMFSFKQNYLFQLFINAKYNECSDKPQVLT